MHFSNIAHPCSVSTFFSYSWPQVLVDMRTASSQTSNAVEAASKLLNCFHLKNRKGNSVEFEKATGLKIPCLIERYERIAWFAFHKMYEEAVMSILLSTVAPEPSHD